MSTSFYKKVVAPTLLKSYSSRNEAIQRSVEVWTTTCIVTNFGSNIGPENSQQQGETHPRCNTLINPSNPQLTGTSKFPYFPKGGPVPEQDVKLFSPKNWQPLGYVTSWGGMDVGNGMMYSVSVIDGLVHQMGGLSMQFEIKMLPVLTAPDEKCPVGQAVKTTFGKSAKYYPGGIIHTTPPFYKFFDMNDPLEALRQCYSNSLWKAFSNNTLDEGNMTRVAVPLLGAGCRGFPVDVASEIAAQQSASWLCGDMNDGEFRKESQNQSKHSLTREVVAFGIPDVLVAKTIIKYLDQHLT